MRSFKFLASLVLLAALASLGFGQASLPSTTLSAAVTSTSATTLSVASASDFVVGYAVFCDYEYMTVTAISGTNIGVMRGVGGTRATTHASGARIWVAPRNYYTTYDRAGSCTMANELNLPTINIRTGQFWNCVGSKWLRGEQGETAFEVPNIAVGSVALNSLGSETTFANGTTFWASIFIPKNKLITGIGVLNGATVGTDKVIYSLYPGNGGAKLANTAVAGTISAGANAFQEIALTATYYAVGPAYYYIGVQANGTTAKIRTIAASTFLGVLTTSSTGTFATIEDLTAPTTFTADVGPIAYVY